MKTGIKNLVILLACTGLIAGIGAFIAQYSVSRDINASLLMGIIVFCLTGVVITLAGLWFTRFDRSRRGLTAFQFILLPLLGIALAVPTAAIAETLVTGEWQPMQPAPETATGFIADEHATIYGDNLFLQAASGSTYVYDCANAVECYWTQKEYAQVENPDTLPCEIKPAIEKTPALPGQAIDNLDSVVCHVDGSEHTRFILLGDGGVYYWSNIKSFNNSMLRLYGFAFFGLLAGLVASAASLKMRKRIV